ncbi:fibrillin-1-like [Macrosteles quadrilineatus]|uniref:fibrillin-1-like n=1 Tax=Macrosteles quadrilineatus TaxID=74068 RepID=UPI0023E2ED14|nr:fibrillin-1-like [Macrosteles quadrilineatus]
MMLHLPGVGVFLLCVLSHIQGHPGCSERGAPDHGRVRVLLQRTAGLMVTYSCDPGYYRTGHLYSVCLRGVWTTPLPSCVAVTRHSGEQTDGTARDQGILVSREELPSTERSVSARRVIKTKQMRKKRKRKRKDKRMDTSAIAEGNDSSPEKSFDTSCLLGTTNGIPKFVRPPKVPNSVGPKFVRRKSGSQKYLVAIYRCVAGYKLHNPHNRNLGCQNSKWIGTLPICLTRRKKIGCINAGCDHGCKEVGGKPKCFCFKGFRQNGKQCIDENECFDNNGGCQQSCHNTPGSFYCGCPPGYRLATDRSSCVDINECLSRNGHGPCQGQCHNVDGSFVCSCEGFPGSKLAEDGVSCADINECSDPVHRLNCSHACVNTRGSAFCLCPPGYELGTDWKTCHDINECERGIAPCNHGCVNTIGSFTCSSQNICSAGYVMTDGVCKDTDECTENTSTCSHTCINTPGSFRCSCPIGFVLADNGSTCIDLDECSEFAEGHLCSHICQNILGSYSCQCPSDYELASDHRTCHPKEDVCQRKNCSHDCLIEDDQAICVCDEGYTLENDTTCVDIDECEENTANCSHNCINEEGAFYCTCPTGYSLLPDKKTCSRGDCLKQCHLEGIEDSICSCPEYFKTKTRNCESGGNLCSQLCTNNEESFICHCRDGYYLDSDLKSCLDIDECQEENICSSNKTCINTEGSYSCNCPPGFREANGSICEDIDECSFTVDEGASLCSHVCTNTLGSFRCECPLGYTMGLDSRTCADIDECSENNEIDTTCSHKCVNSVGSYQCECPENHFLKDDHICVPANACETNNGGCSHICIDNDGYPICECPEGFTLTNDSVTCEPYVLSCLEGYIYQIDTQQCTDINECLNNNGNCTQICQNTEGSFSCTCFTGFEKIEPSQTCLDMNECANNVSVCDQICINTEGSYKCGCHASYKLSETLTECIDVDECANNICEQICQNSKGSFKCECKPGYTLASDGVSCVDLNECFLNISNCSQICNNLDGGFSCECNPGFVLVNGSVCVKENEVEEEQCEHGNFTVKKENRCCCETGYVLVNKTKCVQMIDCYQSAGCDLSESESITCPSTIEEKALGCAPMFPDKSPMKLDCGLTTKQDTLYYPAGSECRVGCRPGYKLDGPRVTTCLNGSWSGSFQCIAQIRPYIKCPPTIRLNLPQGRNSTIVNIQQPTTNMDWEKHVTSKPPWGKNLQQVLSVGTVSVQFFAVSPSSNYVAKCTTSIQVKDVEKPTIHSCPEDMKIFVLEGQNSTLAAWREPDVTDNVKVAYLYKSQRPGTVFSRGLHAINYIATDSSGNIASCQFTINVV